MESIIERTYHLRAMPASISNQETKERLPGALAWLRAQLDCSWSELAREMDIDYVDLCKIRRGERLPTPHQALMLWRLVSKAGLSDGFLDRSLAS